MPGRQFTNGNSYRYGFNGKENDNEVKGTGDQQDYGMRIYDPRLSKFLSVDPLVKRYAWLTPFQFAENSPIQFIDIDGKESGWLDNGMGRQYMGSGDIGNVYRKPVNVDLPPVPQPAPISAKEIYYQMQMKVSAPAHSLQGSVLQTNLI